MKYNTRTIEQCKVYIEHNILDIDVSYRGGSIKVDVSGLFPYVDTPVIGAYQNYLGGGLAGSIVGAAMFSPDELHKRDVKRFERLLEACKRYFFELQNDYAADYDDWSASDSYEQLQARPVSGY